MRNLASLFLAEEGKAGCSHENFNKRKKREREERKQYQQN